MTSYFNSEYGWTHKMVPLKKASLFYNVNLEKKREFIIYDYKYEKRFDISTSTFGSRLGYSDSSIYVYIEEKRANINGSKFKKGDIVSISKNGAFKQNAKVLNYIYPPDSGQHFYQQFYNGVYLIKGNFLRHEFINCEHSYYYKYYIYDIDKKIIDSINCKQISFGTGNLPEIKNDQGRLIVYNQDYFKIYSNKGNVYSWTTNQWSNNYPILETEYNKCFLLVGDILFFIVDIPTLSNSIVKTTLNNMILNNKSPHYQTIFAFDIIKNRFIGYPTIKLEN
jgi:hypothetical protein